MSDIFISHSSSDSEVATQVQKWLSSQGHEAFLASDPREGIPAGRLWERELYAKLRRCQIVLILWSEHWRASKWCFAELAYARALGKYIIPIRIDASDLDEFVVQDTQSVDWNAGTNDALTRLAQGLITGGLELRRQFSWDRQRSPYPGMVPFEAADAGVFFGRDHLLREGLDRLNQHYRFGGARCLVMLGASGSGKSSLLRAGLLPRLRRDPQRWLVVNPFRPLHNPFQELALVINDAFADAGQQYNWRALRDTLQDPEDRLQQAAISLTDVLLDLRVARKQREATVLFAIDQAEELLTALSPETTKRFLSCISSVLSNSAVSIVAIMTVRSDFAAQLQDHESLRTIRLEPMVVTSPPPVDFIEIIEGPARLAELQLEFGLVHALLQDIQTPDAMPLLAFTLRELWDRSGSDGVLTLQEYRQLGGLTGSISAVAQRLIDSENFSATQLNALKHAFLSLVGVDDEFRYVRRPALKSQLPLESHTLVERFAQARLLILDRDADGDATLEVAHEALFTAWPVLHNWLEQHRADLKIREDVRRACREWHEHACDPSYLVHRGRRLAEAAALERSLAVRLTSAESQYTQACREAEEITAAKSALELSEVGWGVIFPQPTDEGILAALRPLLEHRRQQANRTRPKGYREFTGTKGYRPGETAIQFLWRQGVVPGVSDRDRVPHYLLIVGDPQTIPFEVQYELSTNYAVGRIHFDTPDEYAAYARNVVAAETGERTRARRLTVFAPQHTDDRATQRTVDEFVKPLVVSLTKNENLDPEWSVEARVGKDATKAELRTLLGGDQTPALLFAVAHGVAFPSGSPQQLSMQGALVCSDWMPTSAITADALFSAADVDLYARLSGVIAFLIGEYTGGTPRFPEQITLGSASNADEIAPHSFLAKLPQRLLNQSNGGALAVVGHVERTWIDGGSLLLTGGKSSHEVPVFARVLRQLLRGEPVGVAMRPIFQRYTDYATQITKQLEWALGGRTESADRFSTPQLLANLYDARDYIIVGDPAVRLWPPKRTVAALAQPASSMAVTTPTIEVGTHVALSDVGWGVLFAANAGMGVRASLGALLRHRRLQIGDRAASLYREFSDEAALQRGESVAAFLSRQESRVSQGRTRLPRFILIAADLESVPHRFEIELAAHNYFVGRLHFDDPMRYRNYAGGVIAAESGAVKHPRRAAFFSPQYTSDPVSAVSLDILGPLAETLESLDWQVLRLIKEGAMKSELKQLLLPDRLPALLFAITRSGPGGALLCQDCPAEVLWNLVTTELLAHSFSTTDLDEHQKVIGLVAFLFTSRGLGDGRRIAPLAEALLGHEAGGALAVVGSYDEVKVSGRPTNPFLQSDMHNVELRLEHHHEFLRRLAKGSQLGVAVQALHPDPLTSATWLMLGDPAVRMPV